MKNGFTLIELLVVVAITSVVMVTGFVYLGNYRAEQNLKLTSSELLPAVKNTQGLSKSEQNGKRWGVHFVNTTSSAGQSYSVFSGTSYATSGVSQTYPLRRNVSFSNPWVSSTIDTIFNAVTGYPSQPQVISIVDGRRDGIVNDIIINSLGQITSKFDTGLVGYWHLDENTSSTAYDASGLGNSGILQNGPTWNTGTTCEVSSCLYFNGSTNYITTGGSGMTSMGDFTVQGWTYLTDGSTSNNTLYSGSVRLLVRPSGYYFGLTIGATEYYNQGTFATNADINNWVMWDFVRSGSNITFYRNGSTFFSSSTVPTTGVNLTGAIGLNNTYYMKGYIDEVKIYNRALSAAEIMDQYSALR